jgi:hypothetical protein
MEKASLTLPGSATGDQRLSVGVADLRNPFPLTSIGLLQGPRDSPWGRRYTSGNIELIAAKASRQRIDRGEDRRKAEKVPDFLRRGGRTWEPGTDTIERFDIIGLLAGSRRERAGHGRPDARLAGRRAARGLERGFRFGEHLA